MSQIIISIIKFYQKLSRACLLKTCRFHPSCSDYAIDAIQKHGAFKGIGKAGWRIFRCSPLFQGGYDPVR